MESVHLKNRDKATLNNWMERQYGYRYSSNHIFSHEEVDA